MIIETDEDLVKLQKIGKICANILQAMQEATRVGITTRERDELGGRLLAQYGATSAPMLEGFPGYTCISVNEEIAHGIPGGRMLRSGDLVNIDVSAELDGYFGDTGASFLLGKGDKMAQRLLRASKEALANAITLTPGTITVLLEDNSYTVHCLDESLAEGMNESVFLKRIEEIEKGGR